MRVVACLFTEHNLWLVGLAALVCVTGSWIGFRLYGKVRASSGPELYGWVFLTSVAVGSAVWCTHFIAMLAYEVSAPVSFDAVLTLVSLVIIIGGCALALWLGSIGDGGAPAWVVGSIIGLAVAVMHYTGMAAYHVSGDVAWSLPYVATSVLISVVVAALAFHVFDDRQYKHAHALAVGIFVLSVVGLHFTGMAAVQVSPFPGADSISNTVAFQAMAVAVAGVATMIIGTGVASYLIDQRSTQESVERLRQMALNDTLTGLPNRAHFTRYLDSELARARQNGWRLAVIGIDLDRFKEINDLRGHEAGDMALQTIATRLATCVSPGEFIARIGGDEFAAVKRYTAIDEVHDFAARLERQLFKPLDLGDFRAVPGASIGVALYPEDGLDARRLVSNADLAMYRAKADIQRAICYYEEKMDAAARERSELAADLRRAIERGEFEVHYQVQNDVATGKITGHEVLLRWRHPRLGMVPPAKFIPIAEETGSIVEIGEWVLRTACREAAAWPARRKIAVNVSAVQLLNVDLDATVHAILMETDLPPERLEIEITESTIIQDKVRTLQVLRRLRSLGVTVAIDDFGVGYSSLETLRAFPFDKIKLDRTFTQGLESDVQAKAIIRAVIALGRSLDIRVLAEGVETNDQLNVLRSEGCNEVQGFFLGRPVRHPDVTEEGPQKSRGSTIEAA
jgi:diguanylate cyclase (GGDEF)-like protein